MSEREADTAKRRSIRRQRNTSIDAYQELRESGKLGRLRWTVYDHLFSCGPATGQECFKALKLETNQSGRFTELRDMGLIKEVGTLVCRVTGREVIGWDVTDRSAPVERKPAPSREAILEETLRAALAELRAEGTLFSYALAKRLERTLEGTNDGR